MRILGITGLVLLAYVAGWVHGRADERREQWWRERGEPDGA